MSVQSSFVLPWHRHLADWYPCLEACGAAVLREGRTVNGFKFNSNFRSEMMYFIIDADSPRTPSSGRVHNPGVQPNVVRPRRQTMG